MRGRAFILLALAGPAGGCVDPPAVADRPLLGGIDVTFFVAADTHFGARGIEQLNRRQIEAMNALPGTPWPGGLAGTVAAPRAVLIAGDLTDHGLGGEWRQFVQHYGSSGRDGRLRYPVRECTGNHDRRVPLLRPVLSGVRGRHGGLTYSWDWGDVHVACLDEYPDAGNRRWLRRDLAAVGRRRPVVIYFHFPLLGPYSDFWSEGDKQAFAEAIEGYNVIAIFHGHFHGSGHYRWAGRDVYNVGSPRHGWHSFAAVRVTDTRLAVASWNWDRGRWQWWHAKAINEGAARPPGEGAAGAPARGVAAATAPARTGR